MGPGLRRDDSEFVVTAVNDSNTLAKHHRHHRARRRGQDGRRDADRAGWRGGLDPSRVAVIEPHPSAEISALAAKGVRLNPTPKMAAPVETLVVAVKPQIVPRGRRRR